MLIGQRHTKLFDREGSQPTVHNVGSPKAILQTPSGDIRLALVKIYFKTGHGSKTHEQELQVYQTDRIVLNNY